MYPKDTLFFSCISGEEILIYLLLELEKEQTLISESKIIKKFFKASEIFSIEPLQLKFSLRKKIVVHSPEEYIDALSKAMFKKGAGKIGEYTMCSFRIVGVGTFKPGSKSNPHLGKQKILSQNNETRLEVECDESVLNDVLDNMLETHPYEEVAYEIYDFRKRDNRSDGSLITFKKKIEYPDLLKRFNKKISEPIHRNKYLKKLALINDSESDIYIKTSIRKEADAVLFVNNKINLIIL